VEGLGLWVSTYLCGGGYASKSSPRSSAMRRWWRCWLPADGRGNPDVEDIGASSFELRVEQDEAPPPRLAGCLPVTCPRPRRGRKKRGGSGGATPRKKRAAVRRRRCGISWVRGGGGGVRHPSAGTCARVMLAVQLLSFARGFGCVCRGNRDQKHTHTHTLSLSLSRDLDSDATGWVAALDSYADPLV
jgi:hypothetical protein